MTALGEIDDALLTLEMASENVALDNGRATIRRRDAAHDTVMMLIRRALADRDERIAALEAGLREACDIAADHNIPGHNDHEPGHDAAIVRLRALADAPAVDCNGPERGEE